MPKDSISSYHKKAQKAFNKYVKLRDALNTTGSLEYAVCISCGATRPRKEGDAGHFVAQGSCAALRYDEKNVNWQCTTCNRWKHGNLGEYAIKLDDKYGNGTARELLSFKGLIKRWTRDELIEIEKTYNEKAKELECGQM